MASSTTPVVIFGASGYARIVADILAASDIHAPACFVVPRPPEAPAMMGIPIEEEEKVLSSPAFTHAVVAVGDNWVRQSIVEKIRARRADCVFPMLAHKGAHISTFARLGEGCVILPGAVINANARLGAQVSVYSNAVIEHDDEIGDYATLAPTAALGGNVVIGQRSFLGLGATVNHRVTVGADCVIGAQACVTEDIADCSVALGIPARVARRRKPGDAYL